MIDPKYIKDLTPPAEVLDACFVAYLPDPSTAFWRMKKWALNNCNSFIWAGLVDTSDFDYKYDNVTAFYFGEEQDKLMFMLKYST
jgi:hypothetical protein